MASLRFIQRITKKLSCSTAGYYRTSAPVSTLCYCQSVTHHNVYKQIDVQDRSVHTSRTHEAIMSSPWGQVEIPEENVAHYVMREFPKYSNRIALVSIKPGNNDELT